MKFLLLALIATFTFASCGTVTYDSDLPDNETPSKETRSRLVTFSVNGEEGDSTISRAESTTLSDRFSTLHYWIYDKDFTTVVASGTQKTSTDTNFGSFSEYLAYGTYNVVVVGHNQQNEMVLANSNIVELSSEDNRNTDTYYGNSQFTVSDESNSATTITLTRNMCFVQVYSEGTPTNIGNIDLSVSAYGTSFYASSGLANSGKTTNSYKLTLSDRNRQAKRLILYFYFPLPKSETVYDDVSITLTSYDTDGNKIKSVTLSAIPAKIGREIDYVGSLYGISKAFTVKVSDAEWEKIETQKY